MRAAVLVSGCGVYDGAEVSEVIFFLTACQELGIETVVLAPSKNAFLVYDFAIQAIVKEKRNLVSESARMSREAYPLEKAAMKDFDFLIIPGGFGVIQNFFVLDPSIDKVDFEKGTISFCPSKVDLVPEVALFIQQAHLAYKPIIASCLGPIAIARALQGKVSITTTFGKSHWNGFLEKMGHHAVQSEADQVIVDRENHLFSTPAYFATSHRPTILKAERKALYLALASVSHKKWLPVEIKNQPLTEGHIKDLLLQMDHWKLEENKLLATFTFPSYEKGLHFVHEIGELAEMMGHHPKMTLLYDKVKIELWTHDLGSLSEKDYIMAQRIDVIYNKS